MIQTLHQPGQIAAFLPLIILWIPMVFIINRLAKEKGKNVVLWTILGCIPIINMIVLPYMIGTPSKIQEEKLDRILELLNKKEEVKYTE